MQVFVGYASELTRTRIAVSVGYVAELG
jgi:hypothetical protein